MSAEARRANRNEWLLYAENRALKKIRFALAEGAHRLTLCYFRDCRNSYFHNPNSVTREKHQEKRRLEQTQTGFNSLASTQPQSLKIVNNR